MTTIQPSPPTGTVDNRAYPRKRVDTTGEIIVQGGFRFDVKVKDISLRGARIVTATRIVLPQTFRLEILSPDRARVKICECVRRWQFGNACGVQFRSSKTVTLG
tara:strand:- start:204 stop:515 length:312 start_codon:yes stop_codon:yes gene_type:complete